MINEYRNNWEETIEEIINEVKNINYTKENNYDF